MARPIKQGLDYFPLDVDFFNDDKIQLIEAEFGIKGTYIAIRLLTKIYSEGYYVEYSELLKNKLARVGDLNLCLIDEVVNKLVKYDFFDKDIFRKHNMLTSKTIQKNWVKISQYIPNFFIISNVNLIKEIKIPKYKLLDEKPRLYQYNVKLWYRIIKEVFKRDNYTCQYCGQIGGKLEADHINPFSKGGSDEMSNLITSCRKCNRQKKDKSANEFIKWRENRYEKN